MSSPQKENGYVAIASELFDALARTHLSGYQRQVLDVIIRKTYGYNKKEDSISLSQFVKLTGLKKQHICRAISDLLIRNIITKKDNDIANSYGILKNYDLWKTLPKLVKAKVSLPKLVKVVTKIGNTSLPKLGHTITTTTKDNITIDSSEPSSHNPENIILGEFKEINPMINFGNKTQRQAVTDLLKEFGEEKLTGMIKWYKTKLTDKFCPTATTPLAFKNKLGDITIYANKLKETKPRYIDLDNL